MRLRFFSGNCACIVKKEKLGSKINKLTLHILSQIIVICFKVKTGFSLVPMMAFAESGTEDVDADAFERELPSMGSGELGAECIGLDDGVVLG